MDGPFFYSPLEKYKIGNSRDALKRDGVLMHVNRDVSVLIQVGSRHVRCARSAKNVQKDVPNVCRLQQCPRMSGRDK